MACGINFILISITRSTPSPNQPAEGRKMFNFGFDARNYYPIYRNFIWALRVAGDFSWGNQKMIYYLGGQDGWMFPKANPYPQPDYTQNYAYQSLAVNLRGYNQNVANGNNAIVINSEYGFRYLPRDE